MTEIREIILEAVATKELKKDILEELNKEDPVDYREVIRVHSTNIENVGPQEQV